MTQGRLNVPWLPRLAMAFCFALLVASFPAVGGSTLDNSTASPIFPSDAFSLDSSFLSAGTADVDIPVVWPRFENDMVIDPNCDPKLVIRQLGDNDEKLDCPCCISRDGYQLLPFATASRPNRPAAEATPIAGDHSLWAATATIAGEPVPTDSDELELDLCIACDSGVCSLASNEKRQNYDDDDDYSYSDDDDFSIDEEDDTKPDDILQTSLTHPDTWEPGIGSWWGHMYDLAINRGARSGARLRPGVIDPRLETHQLLSHSSMIFFDRKDKDGKLIRADDGLAGGIIPIYGCTGIVIVSDHGAYTAHIWEVPTFRAHPGTVEDEEIQRLQWELRIDQFFEKGNKGIVSPPSPALADLVKPGGPFAEGEYSWIQVHVFGVADHVNSGPKYADQLLLLEAELYKYLKHIKPDDLSRHLYQRWGPDSNLPTASEAAEFFKDNAGHQIVAWQYAPEEPIPHPTEAGKTQKTRAFRLWWSRHILTTKHWCIPGDEDCYVPCSRAVSEVADDPEDQATGSGNQARRDVAVVGPAAAPPPSLDRREDPPPRRRPNLPREFTQMFPGELIGPDTWAYFARDWWKRMHTVAVRYGATGASSELLNVASGDDYAANHCVYRDLFNLEHEGTGGGITPLYGCTGLVVASNKGVYTAHFWEQPTFFPPPGGILARKPELYGDEKKVWDRRVTGMLKNGWKSSYEKMPGGPSLEQLSGTVFRGPGVDWLKVWVLMPDKSNQEVTGVSRYPSKYEWLLDDLKEILKVSEDNIDLVTYVKSSTGYVAAIGSDKYYANNPGIHMLVWQFAPDAVARQEAPDFHIVNALRVFWDREEIFYHEWCPPNKDCAASDLAYCSQRAVAGPSKREVMIARRLDQDDPTPSEGAPPDTVPPSSATPAGTEVALDPSGTAAPTEGAIIPIFLRDFTSPKSWGAGEEHWWKQMQEAVHDNGARVSTNLTAVDDYARDHATFNSFDDGAFGTGIEPMWGCTGIVVMSDKGVYTARFWEAPNFISPHDPTNKHSYTEDEVWENRLKRFLWAGAQGDNGSSIAEVPALLKMIRDPTGAFSPRVRQWLHVEIITPEAEPDTDGAETTALYFKKVARIRDELASMFEVKKDVVKVKAYSPRNNFDAHRTNGTTEDMDGYFRDRRGANMLAIQYAPRHPAKHASVKSADLRGVRLWWDKKPYLTHFWCPPKTTAATNGNSTLSTELACTPIREKSSGQLCQFSFTPRVFPNDNMRVELGLDFSRMGITPDGQRDMASIEQFSKHSFGLSMGGMVVIRASESGMAEDFYAHVGRDWQEYLWDMGYECGGCGPGKDGGCEPFTRACCRDNTCPEYACNCKNPGAGGELCWPDQRHVARCCLTPEGCPDPALRRLPEDWAEPKLDWEYFEHGFVYGNRTWSSRKTEDPAKAKYPLIEPFCQRSLAAAKGYSGPDVTTKDFVWELSSICYFTCGEIQVKNSSMIALPAFPTVPLADDNPKLYADRKEPVYDQGSRGNGTWTTGTGPVPTGLL